MSLDGRLKQGLTALADPIDVDYELGLVRVQAVARQRERRNIMIAAFAGAAAAIALLAGGGRLADMVLGIEVPLPPAEERATDEDRDQEFDLDRLQDDREGPPDPDKGLVDLLEETTDGRIAGGAAADSRNGSDGRLAYVPPSRGSNDQSQGQKGQGETDPQPPPREPRTDVGTYAGSAVPVGGGQSACDEGRGDSIGCVTFETDPGERTLEISIADQSGRTVAAWVQIDRDGSGDVDGEWTAVCSDSDPISIPSTGDAVVYVEISGGTCQDGTDSNPTSGEVTAVFAT